MWLNFAEFGENRAKAEAPGLGPLIYFTPSSFADLVHGPTANYYDAHLENLAAVAGELDVLFLGYDSGAWVPHPRVKRVRLWRPGRELSVNLNLARWALRCIRWFKYPAVIYSPFITFPHVFCIGLWHLRGLITYVQRLTWPPVTFANVLGDPWKRRMTLNIAEKIAFRRADWLGAGSESLRNYAHRKGVPAGRIALTSNYVEDLLLPVKSNYSHPGPLRVIHVGRLAHQKRLRTLIRAVKAADAELTLVGDGPKRQNLESLANETGARVQFLGQQPNQTLGDRLVESDVFATATLIEAVPKALLEAMAVGLPCVGPDVEGVREYLEKGRGLLVDPTEEGLTQGLKQMAGDPLLRQSLGKAAREYARQNHSKQACMAADRELVGRALRERRRKDRFPVRISMERAN
jgi:glycosyltransferase involved in cell wall biosynthesis